MLLAVAGLCPALPTGAEMDPFVDGSSLWHLFHSSLRTDLGPLGDMAKQMHAAVGKKDLYRIAAPYLASLGALAIKACETEVGGVRPRIVAS